MTARHASFRRKRAIANAFAFLLAASACSQTLDVLEPASARPRDAAVPRDAASAPDGAAPAASCENCSATQLCALDRCVEARGVTMLAASYLHACDTENGRLFCWGLNPNGELGLGDQAAHSRRTRVGSFNDWLAVSTGEHHSCGLRMPGRLYCWGLNDVGQLALGDTVARTTPTAVGDGDRWRRVVCGGDNCCAFDRDGALYCWGDNLEGKLAQNDRQGAPDATRPVAVRGGMSFREVAVGQGHVCAIRDDGALYCWGRNTDLALGIGTAVPDQSRTPLRVGSASDWHAIAGSQHHTCGVRGAGELYCWGRNMFAELATNTLDVSADPLRVGSDSDWTSIWTGWFHSCAMKRDGRVWCWGRAIEGQLGQGGSDDPIPTPTLVATPANWQRIALGNFTSFGVNDGGELYAWGKNESGELGLGDQTRRFVPTPLPKD